MAIWAERGAPLVWGVLGTLAARRRLLLLDPAYPSPRLSERIRLARPRRLGYARTLGRRCPPQSRRRSPASAACA